jgi:hypothetical protein
MFVFQSDVPPRMLTAAIQEQHFRKVAVSQDEKRGAAGKKISGKPVRPVRNALISS